MTDLHAAIGAALDREQSSWRGGPDAAFHALTRRVEADRRVLARHSYNGWGDCSWCEDRSYPCPDLLDLAARLDVETSR